MLLFLLSVVVAVAADWATRFGLRKRPGLLSLRSQRLVWAAVGVSAALGLAAPGSPTGNQYLDAAYRALFAGGVTLAASRARRWSWIVATGAVVLADHGGVAGIPAGAGLGVALGSSRTSRPGRAVGAAIGLVTAQGALRMRWSHPSGASAALAALILAVLVISHLRRLRSRQRRRALVIGGAIAGLGLAAVAAYGAAAWSVRGDAQTGLDQAEAALAAARSGQADQSAQYLAAARQALANVAFKTDAWWDRPALAVPAVAQNVRAVAVVVRQASVVLGDADGLLQVAGGRDLRMNRGTVDLARIEGLAAPLETSRRALAVATAAFRGQTSVWLVGPLRSRLAKLEAKLNQTADSEATLAVASQQLPGILGSAQPRRWLLVVMDNSELRGGGGLISEMGIIGTAGGHVSLISLAPTSTAQALASGAVVTGHAEYMARYGWLDPAGYPGDDAHSPDFPTDASVLAQLYPQWTGTQVDGVIGIDAFGLAALLQITGPVSVAGWPVPISAANAVAILLHDQYIRLAGTARSQFLIDLAHAVFSHLTAASLPGPSVLAAALGPAAAGHHVQLYSSVPAEESLFDLVGASGRMAPVRGDFLEVVTHNFSQDKDDWYLTRSFAYNVNFNSATDSETARLIITLRNSSPAGGEPAYILGGGVTPPGYDRQWVNIYTPLDLAGARLGSGAISLASARELGRNVYSGYVTVPPGGVVTMAVDLYGFLSQAGPYQLRIGYQPAAHPDQMAVNLTDTKGRIRSWRWVQDRAEVVNTK